MEQVEKKEEGKRTIKVIEAIELLPLVSRMQWGNSSPIVAVKSLKLISELRTIVADFEKHREQLLTETYKVSVVEKTIDGKAVHVFDIENHNKKDDIERAIVLLRIKEIDCPVISEFYKCMSDIEFSSIIKGFNGAEMMFVQDMLNIV